MRTYNSYKIERQFKQFQPTIFDTFLTSRLVNLTFKTTQILVKNQRRHGDVELMLDLTSNYNFSRQ